MEERKKSKKDLLCHSGESQGNMGRGIARGKRISRRGGENQIGPNIVDEKKED